MHVCANLFEELRVPCKLREIQVVIDVSRLLAFASVATMLEAPSRRRFLANAEADLANRAKWVLLAALAFVPTHGSAVCEVRAHSIVLLQVCIHGTYVRIHGTYVRMYLCMYVRSLSSSPTG